MLSGLKTASERLILIIRIIEASNLIPEGEWSEALRTFRRQSGCKVIECLNNHHSGLNNIFINRVCGNANLKYSNYKCRGILGQPCEAEI